MRSKMAPGDAYNNPMSQKKTEGKKTEEADKPLDIQSSGRRRRLRGGA